MRIADPYVDELTSEASTTRRVLERVPEAHLNWRPHEKSMSLGQLALHVATLPRQLTEFVTGDALDFSGRRQCAADGQQSPGTPGRIRVQHGASPVLPGDTER